MLSILACQATTATSVTTPTNDATTIIYIYILFYNQSSPKRTSNIPTNLNVVFEPGQHTSGHVPPPLRRYYNNLQAPKLSYLFSGNMDSNHSTSPVSTIIAAWQHHTYNFATTRHPNMPSWEERGSTNPSKTSSAHIGLGTTDSIASDTRQSTQQSQHRRSSDFTIARTRRRRIVRTPHKAMLPRTQDQRRLHACKHNWVFTPDRDGQISFQPKHSMRLGPGRPVGPSKGQSKTSHSDFKKAGPRADLTWVCVDQQFLLRRRHLCKAA